MPDYRRARRRGKRFSYASRRDEPMTKYNTNLAAEFYVLSMLYRLGTDAALTLGNKKAVDIVVVNEDGTTNTIDVKGLARPYDWPADNIHLLEDPHHFYVLVSFEGKIMDPQSIPSTWIIPSVEMKPFIHQFKIRKDVSRAVVKENGKRFLNAWSPLIEQKASKPVHPDRCGLPMFIR
jgi:hypothetical protein